MAKLNLMLIYIVFTFITWTSFVLSDKSCPQIQLKENFNLTTFSNKNWYEIARYSNNFERKGDCATLFTYYDNGSFKFNVTEIVDGNLNLIEGSVESDEKNPGILYLHSSSLKEYEVNHVFPIQILEADYDNFAFTYDCRYDETTQSRNEFAWVFGRTTKLEGKSKQEFDELMETHSYIDINKLTWIHFTENYCKIKE